MRFEYPNVTAITPQLEGFYRIDHEAYHAGPGISSTRVKRALGSYASYIMEREDTDALAFGRAFHMALLEPLLFAHTYVPPPSINGHKNSNAYKADYAAWLQSIEGRIPISNDDWEAIFAMVKSVGNHPLCPAAKSVEIMGITTCPETGYQLKCKADVFDGVIVDYKSASGPISDAEFTNEVLKWRYHVSAAFYQDIFWRLTGERFRFIVVPVQKKAPYECEYYELPEEFLTEGRRLYKAGLKRMRKWESMPESARFLSDKRKRVLRPTPRLLYTTTDILNFIGED